MPENATTEAATIELEKTEGERRDQGQEDIVVDLPYVELVVRLIRERGVDADPDMDRMSPALGLGVVVVQDIQKLANEIDPMSAERIKLLRPNEPPESKLDKVLVWLRQEFRRIDPTSRIEVGKNRTMRRVESTPHIGGGDYPVAANEPVLELAPEAVVTIGLIDTQVYRHPQFRDRLKFIGRGELSPVGPFNHLDIHGTFTVGLILQRAPGAEVVVKAVLSGDDERTTAWDVASAMTEFLDERVKVLVLPLVCFTANGKPPLALQRAVTLLRRYGIAVIAAAGNHGKSLPQNGEPTNTWRGFPAACDGAVAVGATDADGEVRANFNPRRASWIELAGPGIKVDSTSVTGKIEYTKISGIEEPADWHPTFKGGAKWSGTSFATATVGGVIAHTAAEEKKSAFEVIEDLKAVSPAANGGIGRYEDLQ